MNSLSADVVVIGAGLAGNAAALAAAEAGASVVLLEKSAEFGGTSVKSGGGLVFAGTDQQRAMAIEDSLDALRRDIFAAGRDVNDPAAVDAYVNNQLATYEWLTERGVEFVLLSTGATGETSRMHASLPGQAARALHDRVLAHPRATYLSNTPARKLVRGADGRVSGVSVGRDDEESVIAVGRGVVLASGGFNRSPQLLQIFAPRWVDAVKMGGTENTGDGLRMAWALGAQLADMAYIEASFGASAAGDPEHGEDPDREPILLYPNVQGAVIVNSEGHRFIDEGLNYKRISAVCEEQPNGLAFQVFDQAMMDRSTTTTGPWNFKAALADGYLRRGDTIEQLAVELGVDPAALQATIERYNRFADDGVDADFGRIIHGHGAPTGGRLAVPPFYAFPSTSGLTTTYCGVKVDETLQVIDVFGEPIAGLFAAGEVVGGFHGAGYLSGTAMGKAAIFGRTAGISAARA